eukprot:11405846-Heterocapsa_arctica.AAC.1
MSIVLTERRKPHVAEVTGDYLRCLYTKEGSARRREVAHITQMNTNLLNAGADNFAEGALISNGKTMK